VDIGSLAIGSTTVRSFSIVNASLAGCNVVSFALAQGSSSELGVAGPAVPFYVPAGTTSQEISIMFDPVQPGMVTGAVNVQYDAPSPQIVVPITAEGTGMAIDGGSAPDVGPHCVAIGDPCDNIGTLCCQGAACIDIGGGHQACVFTAALDGGTMCLPNSSSCTNNDQCCSQNCIQRVSPGYCCEPGGCP
jgi:hypothetical protein